MRNRPGGHVHSYLRVSFMSRLALIDEVGSYHQEVVSYRGIQESEFGGQLASWPDIART